MAKKEPYTRLTRSSNAQEETHLDLANADAVHRDAEVVKYLEEEEEKEVQFYMIFGDLSISYSD